MFVVFSSNDEIIITTPELETQVLDDFFINGGRVMEDYDREEVDEVGVEVSSRVMWE